MNYKIEPGLYAMGKPDALSPVLVSANYKMSFDILRREVGGYDLWVLVLDTKGINVWCAAGKGTFCAGEIMDRAKLAGLTKTSPGSVLVLPQLSATGVKAYEVQKSSGFQVVYGPVRARDIPAFLDRGMKASPEMRTVKFGIIDRLVLTPCELVWSLKYLVPALALIFILGGLKVSGFDLSDAWKVFYFEGFALLGAVISGTVITPLLLPWVPGRYFFLKGFQLGFIWALALIAYRWFFSGGDFPFNVFGIASILFLIPGTSAFFALNFTGSTTFTSPSGVKKEMKLALPAIIGSAAIGAIFFIVGLLSGKI